jgi:hypothetical protein
MTKDEKKAADKAAKAAKAKEEEEQRRAKQSEIDNDENGVEKATVALEEAQINFDRVVSNFTDDTRYEGSIADMHHATVMLAYCAASLSRAKLFADKKAGRQRYSDDSYFFDEIFRQQMVSEMAIWRKYENRISEWSSKIWDEANANHDVKKGQYLRKRATWANMIARIVHTKTSEINAKNIENANKRRKNRMLVINPDLNFTLGKSIYTVESTESLERKKIELQQQLETNLEQLETNPEQLETNPEQLETNLEIKKDLDLIEQELKVKEAQQARDDMNKTKTNPEQLETNPEQLETNPEIKKDLDLIEQELKVRTQAQEESDDMKKMMMISDAAQKNYKMAQQAELQARSDFKKLTDLETPTAQAINELDVARFDKLLKQKKSKLDAIMNEQEKEIKELEHQLVELKNKEREEIIKEAKLTGFNRTPGYNPETVTAYDVYQYVHLKYTLPNFKLDEPSVMSGNRVTAINQRIRALQTRLNQAQEETPEETQAKLEYHSANIELTSAQVTLATNKVELATDKKDKKEVEAAQKELEKANIDFENAQKDQEESLFKLFLEQRGLKTSPVVISSDFNRIAAIELVLRIYNELRQLRNSDDSLLKMKLKSKAIDAIKMAKKYIDGAKKDHQTFMKPSIERRSIERDAFSAAMRTDRIANNALVKAEKENPEEAQKVAAIAKEIEIASTDADNAESAVNLAKFNVEEAINAFKYYEKEALRGKTYAESYQKEIDKEQDSKKQKELIKRQQANTKYSQENKALADKKNEDAKEKEIIYQEKLKLAEQKKATYDAKTKEYLEALYTLSPYCREKRDEANIADQKWLVTALKLMKVQRKEYEQRKLAIEYTPGYQTIKERLMEKPNFVQYIHNKINMAKGEKVTREYIIELRNETQPFNTEDNERLYLESKGKMSEVNISELNEIADYYILDNKLQEVNQIMDDWEKEWEKEWDTKQSVDTRKKGGTRKNKKRTRKHSRKHNIKKGKKTRRHRSKRYK